MRVHLFRLLLLRYPDVVSALVAEARLGEFIDEVANLSAQPHQQTRVRGLAAFGESDHRSPLRPQA